MTGRCACCARSAASGLVDLPDADQCCGFGGTFALKNSDTSAAMGSDKAVTSESGAEVLVRGRQLVPDARRRACSRGSAAGSGCMHLADVLASTERGRTGVPA